MATNLAITAANVRASAYARRFIPTPAYNLIGDPSTAEPALCFAGSTITAGVPVYQGTDNLFYPADANGADPLYKVVGIAENGASANQPVSIVKEDPFFTPGCTLAVGDNVILSGDVGRICLDSEKVAGWFVSQIMTAISTTQAALKITRSDAVKV